MTKTPREKTIFLALSAVLLVFMVLRSLDAGISCDEMIHYNHSVDVYNYFTSHGADRSALKTTELHLKYYGQSYDNIVTYLTSWLHIEDIYRFRNIMSSLAGWLTVFITAMFAVWLAGYGAGITAILLFAVSPTFIGHAFNNLKDIPFALGYISSLFFMTRLILSRSIRSLDVVLLVISMAFAISIRAGGLILICYLFFFWILNLIIRMCQVGRSALDGSGRILVLLILISFSAFFMGILFWPYALQAPFRNVLESYRIMAHYPSTFRQIFEGRSEWSDFMPWYYLPKSMIITIPLIVSAGLIFSYRLFDKIKYLQYTLLIFAIVFPVAFVIIEKSNVYSSWRQFLFLYPVIVLISSNAITSVYESFKKIYPRILMIFVLAALSFHPLLFMIRNHPYEYIYYNQLVGGLKGAYGRYETDYYYTGQTEASKWLIDYLRNKGIDNAVVAATYPVDWFFRNKPGIKTLYTRYEERSQCDWDYMIVTNRYISPIKLDNGTWPPENTIHKIYADGIPVCAVLERRTKTDYLGYKALEEKNYNLASSCFRDVLKTGTSDELIFFNFAVALYNSGNYASADSLLKKSLELDPGFELSLAYLGNIAKSRKMTEEAINYYERLISVNRKYFSAYTELSDLYAPGDILKARKLLRTCLEINPVYKPAITALADLYRKSDPDVAKKYDDMAKNIN